MITTRTLIYRSQYGWRYGVIGKIEIACDSDGCTETIEAAGIEHNGAEVESIYLPDGAAGWILADEDGHVCCPRHAPPEQSTDEKE